MLHWLCAPGVVKLTFSTPLLRGVTPVIWILGHSYIHRAAQRADGRPGGRSLGFQFEVFWRGIGGLCWHQVLSAAVEIGRSARGPVILVIHAGGNDMCFMRMDEMIPLIRADIKRIPGFCPACKMTSNRDCS